MLGFVFEHPHEHLQYPGLSSAIQAVLFGILQSNNHFFAILELYNPDTFTLFTPVRELGFALHEMYEVFRRSIGERPYEEYTFGTEELHLLKKYDPDVHETYWELMCHFHIFAQFTGWRTGDAKHMSWVEYLFPGVSDKMSSVSRCGPSTDEDIDEWIFTTTDYYTVEFNEDTFNVGTIFESFHHQAEVAILYIALFAGFLMLWLKKCMVPTLPHEVVTLDVVYPAVLLAHGRPLGLLPAIVSCVQSGLHVLSSQFCNVTETLNDEGEVVRNKNGKPRRYIPKPRVELPYTYLMAWYAMNCPALMSSIQTFTGWRVCSFCIKVRAFSMGRRLYGGHWEDCLE